jgi:menaquinone-dependent protoporphyrinogen oxidase
MRAAQVLVAYASRAGGTRGIARVIASQLERGGALVELAPIEQVGDPSAYDAVVLGSAVYFGSWEPVALRYVETHAAGLRGRPLWLFSSGPLDPAKAAAPIDAPRGIDELARTLGAREHRIFGGMLTTTNPGIVAGYLAAKGLTGDYRDLAAVRDWGAHIAERVCGSPTNA